MLFQGRRPGIWMYDVASRGRSSCRKLCPKIKLFMHCQCGMLMVPRCSIQWRAMTLFAITLCFWGPQAVTHFGGVEALACFQDFITFLVNLCVMWKTSLRPDPDPKCFCFWEAVLQSLKRHREDGIWLHRYYLQRTEPCRSAQDYRSKEVRKGMTHTHRTFMETVKMSMYIYNIY